MRQIQTNKAPRAVGPYSQAVEAKGLVFCAGQIGLLPQTGALVKGGITVQTRQALKNLTAVLRAAHSSLENATFVQIYLTNMEDFALVNTEYTKHFTKKPFPARVTVGVASLPKNALVEVSCIALTKTV